MPFPPPNPRTIVTHGEIHKDAGDIVPPLELVCRVCSRVIIVHSMLEELLIHMRDSHPLEYTAVLQLADVYLFTFCYAPADSGSKSLDRWKRNREAAEHRLYSELNKVFTIKTAPGLTNPFIL